MIRPVVHNVVRPVVGNVVNPGSFSLYWNPLYNTLYKRFPTKPDKETALLQQTLLENINTGGVLAKLDWLHVINITEGQTVLNWVKDNHNLIKRLSTSFLTKRYFKGNSADGSYMEMDFNPKQDGVNYTNTEAHIGCYMPTNVEEDHTFLFGNSSGGTLLSPATGMICRYEAWEGKVNQGGGTSGVDIGRFEMPGRNAGHVIWQRKSDGKIYGYFNGYPQSVSGITVTGTDLLDAPFYVFKNANTGLNKSDNAFAVIHGGGVLTDADISLLYSEINTYLTAIGANESFGISKLVEIDFEEDTYLRKGAWSVTSGTPDFQYAVAPISGTKSASFPSGAGARLFFPIYSGSVCVKFAIKFTDATPASNSDYLFIGNGAATTLASLKLYTTGRTLLTSGGKTSYGATVKSDGTVYYMWLEYIKGTGANSIARLYLNTIDTKPVTPECEITGGSATGNCNRISPYGIGMVMDDILITPL